MTETDSTLFTTRPNQTTTAHTMIKMYGNSLVDENTRE